MFITIIDVILLAEQYIQRELIHFLTSSTIKELASWDFLKSFIKIVYRKGSMAFLRDSHIYDRVIMAFFDSEDLSD